MLFGAQARPPRSKEIPVENPIEGVPTWDEIVERHSDRVYRLSYRLTGNRPDAEDLTQEVFVRVFRSLSTYTPGTFEGWLHRITTNLFLDQARRKQRIRFDALSDERAARLTSGAPSPELSYADQSFDDDVELALATLPPDFRAAVVLCDVEGLTYEEIAEILGAKLGTVRSRIHRGRAMLRTALRTARRSPVGPATPARRPRSVARPSPTGGETSDRSSRDRGSAPCSTDSSRPTRSNVPGPTCMPATSAATRSSARAGSRPGWRGSLRGGSAAPAGLKGSLLGRACCADSPSGSRIWLPELGPTPDPASAPGERRLRGHRWRRGGGRGDGSAGPRGGPGRRADDRSTHPGDPAGPARINDHALGDRLAAPTRPVGPISPVGQDGWVTHDDAARPDGQDSPDAEPTQPLSWVPPTTQPLPHVWPGFPPPGPVTPQHSSAPAGASASSRLPAWTWPAVAVLALVLGLVGGVVGGLTYDSINQATSPGGVSSGLDGVDTVSLPPLEQDNGSVAAVAQTLLPSTVQIAAEYDGDAGAATGSGFVLDRQGHVITNNHVVADAAGDDGLIEIVDHDGNRYTATVVGRSPVYDLAVLYAEEAKGLEPAALGSSQTLRVGESVVAFGSPLGLSSTVTAGIVSALRRPVTTGDSGNDSSYINAVQTDAAINPGNSGGPLVNLRGQVVGVNSAIATTGGSGEAGNIGVGFAIPIEQVRITADQILRTGEARYPVIGAKVRTGRRDGAGAEVDDVLPGTPAEEGGLRKGDVITEVDGERVTDGIALIVSIRSHQPGETLEFTVQRGSRELTVSVQLGSEVG